MLKLRSNLNVNGFVFSLLEVGNGIGRFNY